MLRKLLFVMLLLLCVGADAQTTSGPEYRGMWVSRFEWPRTTQSATQSNIDIIMTSVRNANFNSVFMQVRGAMETLYPSPNEPWGVQFNYTNPGYDPMLYAINSAHARGLEFHAYINTHCIYQTGTTVQPPPHTTPEHPYWLHGNPADPGNDIWCYVDDTQTTQALGAGEDRYVWTSPGVPSFQTWTREQILYVANNYDVDGVHFDRIRVAGTGSYDPISLARQASPLTNPAGLSYRNWNRDQITRFLNDTYGAIAEVNANRPAGKRHIKVSSAPFGPASSQLSVNQDLSAWTRIGAQDFFCPQVYTASVSTFATRLASNLPNANGRYIVAGMSRNTAQSTPIIQEEVVEARDQGTSGSLVFSYTGFPAQELASYPSTVFGTFVNTPDMPWISSPTDCIIVGNVTDGHGNVVVDAQLTRPDGQGYVWLSGCDGFYSMLKVPDGLPLQIAVNKPGFPVKTVDVTPRAAGSVTRLNISLANAAGQITLDKPIYRPDELISIEVDDTDLAGFGSLEVSIASNSETTPETAILSEQGGIGTFAGTVQLDTGPVGSDGMLQVGDGDTITATYEDADDGTGTPQTVTAQAGVDGSGPIISQITVSNVTNVGATITFTTNEPATSVIQLGTDCNAFTKTVTNNSATTSIQFVIDDLTMVTQYRFVVTATDPAGNITTDDNGGSCHTFTTEGLFSDLAVEIAPLANTGVVGQTISYVISVTNHGPAEAADVVVMDQISTSAIFIGASVSQGSYEIVGDIIQVNLGTLAAHTSTQLTFSFIATETGVLENNLSVGPVASDLNMANNVTSKLIQILLGPGPDLLGAGKPDKTEV